jgi:Protein of unknown function (DUF3467)
MASKEQFPLLYQGAPTVLPTLPTNYVNGVAITVSPWDFCLLFIRGLPNQPLSEAQDAEIVGGRRRGPLEAEIVQRVVMSPEHAKSMVARLQENVELYEGEYGEIPTIPVAPPSESNESKAQAPPTDTGS